MGARGGAWVNGAIRLGAGGAVLETGASFCGEMRGMVASESVQD
jgi:hypothetical protein